MKHTLLVSLVLLLSAAATLHSQVLLYSYGFEDGFGGGTDSPNPGGAVTPTFSIVGTLTTSNWFSGPILPNSCVTGTGGLARSHAGWNTGEAYRFSADVTGYTTMAFAYCNRSSNLTVNNFLCRVSCDLGMNWTTIVSNYVPPNSTTFGSYGGSIPMECDEATDLWIEIYKVDEPGATGNNIRIDNVTLAGFAVLPIELADFTAFENGGTVDIQWTTATETNNDYFLLERSHDGRHFHELAKVMGAGNSSTSRYYSVTDGNPLPGINYYRLRQVDFDGKTSTSPVKSVYFNDHATVSVFPSPTAGDVQIQFSDSRVSLINARVEVYDMLGRQVAVLPYLDQMHMGTTGWESGLYQVRLTDDRYVYSASFIKM